jgi:hypothetical protein
MLQGVTMLQVDAMPDLRLAEILVAEADRAQHRPARCAGDAVDDEGEEAAAANRTREPRNRKRLRGFRILGLEKR